MQRRLLRADRQVADQHLRAGSLKDIRDINRIGIGRTECLVIGIIRHVWRNAVENGSHLDHDAR